MPAATLTARGTGTCPGQPPAGSVA